jgi:hypothetical protein
MGIMDQPPAGMTDSLSVETTADPSASVAIPEAADTSQDANKYSKLVEAINEDFNRSKRKRQSDEMRWLECYRNYRGLYGPTTIFTSTEKSKAFIKITKTKVQAAFAQITDVLFAGNRFPLGIESPNNPTGVAKDIHLSGPPQPGQPPAPDTSTPEPNSQMDPHIAKLFGPKADQLKPLEADIKLGQGVLPSDINFEPAKDTARAMEKQILDQLEEADAARHLRSTIFEACLFGTGAFKGPFAIDKEYPRWGTDGTYNPDIKTIPSVEYVSIWDCYPDADARNMGEAEKFIQRHRMSRTDLRQLKKRPFFRAKNIEARISEGPSYSPEYWESALVEDQNDDTINERWEVLEYWGMMDTEIAKDAGIKLPKEYKGHDQIQVNAWISGSQILRLVFNPFTPARIPYNVIPYELNPYSIFGIGVAENMLDTQLLMNGFMRLAVDNAALSSNVILEINEDYLTPGQTMELFPGKIFKRSGGAPGNAINDIHIQDVSQSALALFDKARQLSDESTGMPSFAHGQTGVTGVGRTASGMSMLMGAAAQSIKAVVRNIDDYLLGPLGKALFAFNMQFNFKEEYIGELTVVAKGTESLMRNEIRSQRLLQLAQFAAPNPSMAPFIKWDYILREYAASLDLDEDKVVNDPRGAQIQALLMAQMQQTMGGPQGQPGAPGQPAPPGGGGAPAPSDPGGNGNGNIAPGNAPAPGAPGFSSNSVGLWNSSPQNTQ